MQVRVVWLDYRFFFLTAYIEIKDTTKSRRYCPEADLASRT
jgi:hypothetical protein